MTAPASDFTRVIPERRARCLGLTACLGAVPAFDPLAMAGLPLPDTLKSDKGRHALTFALLIMPTAALWPRATPVMALVLLVAGGLIEFLQPLFGRERSVDDMLANLFGVALGILTVAVCRKLAARR